MKGEQLVNWNDGYTFQKKRSLTGLDDIGDQVSYFKHKEMFLVVFVRLSGNC